MDTTQTTLNPFARRQTADSPEPTMLSHFAHLYAVNVNEYVEKKGGRPAEVPRFSGLSYLATEAGVFVEVAVMVHGVTLSQIHPVLDCRNRPIMAPSSFEINTSWVLSYFGIASLDQIAATDFLRVVRSLEKKRHQVA